MPVVSVACSVEYQSKYNELSDHERMFTGQNKDEKTAKQREHSYSVLPLRQCLLRCKHLSCIADKPNWFSHPEKALGNETGIVLSLFFHRPLFIAVQVCHRIIEPKKKKKKQFSAWAEGHSFKFSRFHPNVIIPVERNTSGISSLPT